ncbi:ERGIC53, mannose lectin, ER-golgi intermediate compartment [Rhodocollybia butyracea]|uniref:ERGIC53, mannose lectin, ER-golgi intermediate compartment n=1 Tax=Rhodocollybia butyracea TaxID=206335 RepID=A0A9P5UAZ2_9AGAR|nr:ERGIC53, mannose lectin, ER-golgi intermediate compartment [Rhodocollybia butyracea]
MSIWPSFLAFLLLIGHAQAAADTVLTKIGNQTIERTVQLRTHSLFAPYIDQDLQNRWWDFGADSYVNTNKHIRLTRNRPSQMGWLWSRLPLTSQNFVIEVEFKISGDSGHLFGDGMAVWLTTERAQPGPVFGSKNEFTGLGLFLDTYANARHTFAFPRVAAFLGDGKMTYNFGNDGDGQEIGACSANYRRTNIATKLRITYVKDTFLDVKVQYQAWDEWADCFYAEGVSLPQSPFLGFSAMTGDVSDAHDVIAVTTYSAITSDAIAGTSKGASGKKIPGAPSTWTGLFFKLFLFAGVCVGGYYGWMEYQRRNKYGGHGGGIPNFGGMSMGGGNGFGSMYSDPKRF